MYCIRVQYISNATAAYSNRATRNGAVCRVSVSGGLCSPASAVGQAPTDAACNRLGSMSPSCAGDSMPGSFYFAVSSRRPFHTFHYRKAEAREHAALGHVHSARWCHSHPPRDSCAYFRARLSKIRDNPRWENLNLD